MKKNNWLMWVAIFGGGYFLLKKNNTPTTPNKPVLLPNPNPLPAPVQQVSKPTTPVVVNTQPSPQPAPINKDFPKRANAPVVQPKTPVNPTATTPVVIVTNNISSYEGKFILDTKTGMAYKVIGGKLYYIQKWSEVGGVQPYSYQGLITGWPIGGNYSDYVAKITVTPAITVKPTTQNTIPTQPVQVVKPGGAVTAPVQVIKPVQQSPTLAPVSNQTPGLTTTSGKILQILNGTPVAQTGGNVVKTFVKSTAEK